MRTHGGSQAIAPSMLVSKLARFCQTKKTLDLHWRIQETSLRTREDSHQDIKCHGQQGSNKPEPLELRVDRTRSKHAIRSNGPYREIKHINSVWGAWISPTPYDTRREERPSVRASEMGRLFTRLRLVVRLDMLERGVAHELQTSSIFPKVQFMTAICTKQAQIVGITWHMNVTRGGTFM